MVSLGLLNNVSYYSMFFIDTGKVTTVIYGVQKVVCGRNINSPHQRSPSTGQCLCTNGKERKREELRAENKMADGVLAVYHFERVRLPVSVV